AVVEHFHATLLGADVVTCDHSTIRAHSSDVDAVRVAADQVRLACIVGTRAGRPDASVGRMFSHQDARLRDAGLPAALNFCRACLVGADVVSGDHVPDGVCPGYHDAVALVAGDHVPLGIVTYAVAVSPNQVVTSLISDNNSIGVWKW